MINRSPLFLYQCRAVAELQESKELVRMAETFVVTAAEVEETAVLAEV